MIELLDIEIAISVVLRNSIVREQNKYHAYKRKE